MVSALPWWILLFFILNVQRTLSVRIFDNTIPDTSRGITIFSPTVVSKTCMLIPENGPCRSKIRMWYFNPATSNCSTFEWGGCQGNGNRFDTFNDCWGSCMSKPGNNKRRPKWCALTFDYGFCFGAVERWYYDSLWKVCKSTIYSGCGGNKNNFYNLEQCEAICRFGIGAITKQRSRSGGTRKVLIVNPWNTTPRRGAEQTTRATSNTTSSAVRPLSGSRDVSTAASPVQSTAETTTGARLDENK